MFRLAVVFSHGLARMFADAAEELSQKGFCVEVRAYTQESAIDWERFISWIAEEADAVLFSISENNPHYNALLDAISKVSLKIPYGTLDGEPVDISPKELEVCQAYLKYGGPDNIQNLILYIGKLNGKHFEPQGPQKLPWQGYYHPDAEDIFETFNDYLSWYKQRDVASDFSGKIGILFRRHQWINNNLETVNVLIREVEEREMLPVPVFGDKEGDSRFGWEGINKALELLEGVDILINLQSSFLVPRKIEADNDSPFACFDVPVIQTISSISKSVKEWEDDPQGIDPQSQIYYVAQPEFDGAVEPIIIGGRAEGSDPYADTEPIRNRIKYLVDRACAWICLRTKPVSDRKVTFVLHNAPCKSVEATVGKGQGLDTLESVVRIMRRMKENGYSVDHDPEDGKQLIQLIMDKKAISEFRWTTTDEIVKKGGVLQYINLDKYKGWFDKLPEKARKRMIDVWGEPPGEGMVHEDKILVTGLNFGNVNIIVQPKRGCYGAKCNGEVCKILHDPTIPPPHNWLATYKWIEENSDVVIHVGTHGYLEFLPGKGVGLSEECFPEISIGKLPHLYIYTVNNPMEGVIAKRRGYATLIDHMIPVMSASGLYDELDELADLLKQYEDAERLNETTRMKIIEKDIIEKANMANLGEKISDFSELHEKLALFRETLIDNGMHILSEIPDRDGMAEMIVSVLRNDGDNPSIRRKLIETMGYDYDYVVANPARSVNGNRCGEILNKATETAVQIIKEAIGIRDKQLPIRNQIIEKRIADSIEIKNREQLKELIKVIDFGVDYLYPRLQEVSREVPQILRGIDGRFIEPGASGCITKGKINVLPTGRNFYTIDPFTIPTKAAFEVGKRLSDELLSKFLKEEGRYPESIGMVLWSTDVYRADGEEVAQILYLMGAKPVWRQSGEVRDVEVIPLEELGRPRIDVTVRMSGIFRDTVPHLVGLIDDAVQKIVELNESLDQNYVKKHVEETKENMKRDLKEKYDEKLAHRSATYRLFAALPGAYGAGVNLAVAASAWKDEKDLGEVYINHGGYAYGKDVYGEEAHALLAENLSKIEVSFHKLESDESDACKCCCYFAFHGGMAVASRALTGKNIKIYWGDTRNSAKVEVRDMKDEVDRITRTRLLNPKWIAGMKRHGYKGAGEISSRVLHTFGWDATCDLIDDWVYEKIHERFIHDEDMRNWFEKVNPWALEEVARRLLEANARGMWHPNEETLKELQELACEIEGWIEERMGDVRGDFQGSSVDIMTKEMVDAWAEKSRFNIPGSEG